MINLVVGLPAQDVSSASSTLNNSLNNQDPSVSTQAFESQLSDAISQVLAEFGVDPGSVQVSVQNTTSGNNATSQNSAAISIPLSTPASAPAAPATEAASAPATAVTLTAPESVDDAYWSKQPAAVQQLRDMQDPGEKAALASQLASEGYSIDVPIMVWGWDPGITTQLRQSYGYTWVPSALQQPVAEAPGIYSGTLTPYDPAHPPAGSISV